MFGNWLKIAIPMAGIVALFGFPIKPQHSTPKRHK